MENNEYIKNKAFKSLVQKYADEEDILNWGKLMFPGKFTKEFCWELHQYLVDIAEDEFTSTLAPRGFAKTTISCFLIPIFYALNYPKKFRHFLNIQNTASKAISVNITIKQELEVNEKLCLVYGNLVGKSKWTEKQFCLTNGVIFTAIAAGESVRGINFNNIRPDYVIADDLYDENDIGNKRSIEKKEQWFWGSIYKAVNADNYVMHIQGTAIDKTDLMHNIPRKDSSVKFRKFKAIKNEVTKDVLWFTYEKLINDKRRMGSHIFNREMQNECRDDETAIIKEAWIVLESLKLTYHDYNYYINGKKVKKIIGAIDPAVGVKSTNDFTGKCILYVTDDNIKYIFDLYNSRLTAKQNIQHIQKLNDKYRPSIFKLEAISAFQILGQQILEETNAPLEMITAVKDKISRLEGQSYKFENLKVIINRDIDQEVLDEAIYQLTTNEPVHDDIRDAIVLALEDESELRAITADDIFVGDNLEVLDF